MNKTVVNKEKRLFYIPQGQELNVAIACNALQFPLMLRGPTGAGKTTLANYLAQSFQIPIVTENCNEDTLAADLIGRNLPNGWVDGSASRSLRYSSGAIYYLDEIGEARPDAIVVVHSLTDDRRELDVAGHNEMLKANKDWMLIASYNPAYQLQSKVKPSTAQRFITLDIPYPVPNLEEEIAKEFVSGFGKIKEDKLKTSNRQTKTAVPYRELVTLANDYRRMAESADSFGIREGPGTRLVVRTAKLIEYGLPEILAIEVGMINPLTYESEQKKVLFDVAKKLFK